MKDDARVKTRVGVIVFAALLLLAMLITVIGGRTGFFVRRVSYVARFPNSRGVVEGNEVRLSGVNVGAVRRLDVPATAGQDLAVHFDIERRYRHLIRRDSSVAIKTIGLLGDRYLEVTPGTAQQPELEPGAEIPASRGLELDKVLEGSGDLMEDVTAIARSLKSILGRTERGEGLVGELTMDQPDGQALGRSLRQTLDNANGLISDVRTGKGLLGQLIGDETTAKEITLQLTQASRSLNRILGTLETGTAEGKGAIPALLADPASKEKVYRMVDSLSAAAEGLSTFSRDLSGGKGAIPRLVHDAEFGETFVRDLRSIASHLATVAAKLDSDEGTAGKLINDRELHDAMNDIVVGINESKVLRWLIRNRQKAGIEKRFQQETAKEGAPPAAPRSTGTASRASGDPGIQPED